VQKSLVMNRGTEGSVTPEYDSVDMRDHGVESRKTSGLHSGWGLDGVRRGRMKWMWIYGLSDGRDSEINVLNTRLVPPSMTMNPWDESRKIKVIEAIHGKIKSLIDRSIRSNIAQIHHLIQLMSFYIYLFTIQLEYNFIWL